MSTENSLSKWGTVGDLFISVTGPGVVMDQDWQQFIKELQAAPVTKYLAASLGNAESSSTQRKQAAEVMKSKGIRTAVVTNDSMTRGIVTAVSWLGANVSAFSWAEVDKALKYLDVTGLSQDRARDMLAKLRASVEMGRG